MPETNQPADTPLSTEGSDEVTTSYDTNTKGEAPEDERPEVRKFLDSRRNRLIVAISGIALAAVAASVGIGRVVNAIDQRSHTEIVNTLPGLNEESAKTVESTTPAGQETKVDSYEQSMEKYKDMSVETFEALPRDERLLYSQFLIDQTVGRGTYNQLYGTGKKDETYAIKPSSISKNNNGQEIVDSSLFVTQIACLQYIEDVQAKENQYDTSDGVKVLSSKYYDVGGGLVSNGYKVLKEFLGSLTTPSGAENKDTATDTSDLMSGITKDGEKVSYKIVTHFESVDTKTKYTRYIYHEFTSYDGSRKGAWLFDTSGDTLEELKSISTIK